MTWLVIASEPDAAAQWVADCLREYGLAPLTIVTDADFAGATWRHWLEGDRGGTRLELADGRVVDSATVRGTLNRLTHVPPALAAAMAPEDRTYAVQELSALVLSWLASLPGPVLNPPDPRGLCGAWRPPAEWALLASGAGLCPVSVDGAESPGSGGAWQAWTPFAPVPEDAIVVGETVFANRELDAATVAACRCLAARAGTPILGLAFDGDRLAGATPLPDLRAGGDDLVRELAAALGAP
jgi:hypothetical protein